MGKMICKECSKWTSTGTFFCEYCHARLYSEREVKLMFTLAPLVIGAFWLPFIILLWCALKIASGQ